VTLRYELDTAAEWVQLMRSELGNGQRISNAAGTNAITIPEPAIVVAIYFDGELSTDATDTFALVVPIRPVRSSRTPRRR
jgi:hypothetical protein